MLVWQDEFAYVELFQWNVYCSSLVLSLPQSYDHVVVWFEPRPEAIAHVVVKRSEPKAPCCIVIDSYAMSLALVELPYVAVAVFKGLRHEGIVCGNGAVRYCPGAPFGNILQFARSKVVIAVEILVAHCGMVLSNGYAKDEVSLSEFANHNIAGIVDVLAVAIEGMALVCLSHVLTAVNVYQYGAIILYHVQEYMLVGPWCHVVFCQRHPLGACPGNSQKA